MKSKAELRDKIRRLRRKLKKLEKSKLARERNTARADLRDQKEWLEEACASLATTVTERDNLKTDNTRLVELNQRLEKWAQARRRKDHEERLDDARSVSQCESTFNNGQSFDRCVLAPNHGGPHQGTDAAWGEANWNRIHVAVPPRCSSRVGGLFCGETAGHQGKHSALDPSGRSLTYWD